MHSIKELHILCYCGIHPFMQPLHVQIKDSNNDVEENLRQEKEKFREYALVHQSAAIQSFLNCKHHHSMN